MYADEYELLLSAGEAASTLGVDRRTLRRWVASGRLEAVRTPGGHFRFPASAVSALRSRRDRGHLAAVPRGPIGC